MEPVDYLFGLRISCSQPVPTHRERGAGCIGAVGHEEDPVPCLPRWNPETGRG